MLGLSAKAKTFGLGLEVHCLGIAMALPTKALALSWKSSLFVGHVIFFNSCLIIFCRRQ